MKFNVLRWYVNYFLFTVVVVVVVLYLFALSRGLNQKGQ